MKSSDELSRDVIMDGTPIHADDVHLLIFVQQIKISRYSLLCLIHGCAQYFHQNYLIKLTIFDQQLFDPSFLIFLI